MTENQPGQDVDSTEQLAESLDVVLLLYYTWTVREEPIEQINHEEKHYTVSAGFIAAG